jgi:hypothetical protein
VTDGSGAFELRSCALEGSLVRVESDAIHPTAFGLDELHARSARELVVSLRAHLRVELEPPVDRADAFGALDADGNDVLLTQLREGCSHMYLRPWLSAGRSLVLVAPDTARTLVFTSKGEEVGRAPVALEPGQLTVVRW